MKSKHFSSPREEALTIAMETRSRILEGEGDAVDVLRACSVMAHILNKEDDRKWITCELEGYKLGEKIPSYRKITLRFRNAGSLQIEYRKLEVVEDVHLLSSAQEKDEPLQYRREGFVGVSTASLDISDIDNILAKIIDRCLDFLNKIIAELQYGGMVEYLMEEIRQKTDEKLATLDNKITEETRSLLANLASTNPADWSKVGHSCRKILKLLADRVFPPRDQVYETRDKRVLQVGDSNFINRLCAFLDLKAKSDEKKFLVAEIEYFESYLRQAVNYAQMAEHNPAIERFHANMLSIHTYLIASEILKYV